MKRKLSETLPLYNDTIILFSLLSFSIARRGDREWISLVLLSQWCQKDRLINAITQKYLFLYLARL